MTYQVLSLALLGTAIGGSMPRLNVAVAISEPPPSTILDEIVSVDPIGPAMRHLEVKVTKEGADLHIVVNRDRWVGTRAAGQPA
jgi:hypothetical protein